MNQEDQAIKDLLKKHSVEQTLTPPAHEWAQIQKRIEEDESLSPWRLSFFKFVPVALALCVIGAWTLFPQMDQVNEDKAAYAVLMELEELEFYEEEESLGQEYLTLL